MPRYLHIPDTPDITRAFGVKPDGTSQDQTLYAGRTDYLLDGNLVLKDGMMDKLLFEGGYAQASTSGPATSKFTFNYYNQDHLGNNREVVDATGNVKQVTNYYPFGAPYADPAAVKGAEKQPYKYNGKELDKMHGLNTYDYGARQYDPILGRWDRMDPLCEKYYNVSPYAYCANNPVMLIDPNGKKVFLYATTLPGLAPSSFNPLKYATHTFLAITDSKGNLQGYYAYGSEYMGAKGAFNGRLMKQEYSQDLSIISGNSQEFLKAKIEIAPPKGMSHSDFDKKVIDVVNSFGNNKNIRYSAIPTDHTTGNCNTSTSTILLKSGVSSNQIDKIKDLIPGISTGFDSEARPWTNEEQEKAVECKEKIQEMNSKTEMAPFHP